jgi:hypothetical protein
MVFPIPEAPPDTTTVLFLKFINSSAHLSKKYSCYFTMEYTIFSALYYIEDLRSYRTCFLFRRVMIPGKPEPQVLQELPVFASGMEPGLQTFLSKLAKV